jgi:hypothetical protein
MDHPLQASSYSVYTDVGSDKHVISFHSDERFGLVDLSQRGPETSRTVGRRRNALGSILMSFKNKSLLIKFFFFLTENTIFLPHRN